MSRINRFHVSLFAEFLRKMDETKEGEGSLLDHSLYMYGSGMGNPKQTRSQQPPGHHRRRRLGGDRGRRHIRFNQPTPLANAHLTMLDRVGVRLEKFGDSNGLVEELGDLKVAPMIAPLRTLLLLPLLALPGFRIRATSSTRSTGKTGGGAGAARGGDRARPRQSCQSRQPLRGHSAGGGLWAGRRGIGVGPARRRGRSQPDHRRRGGLR